MTNDYVIWFEQLSKTDTPVAGGKGANLGEMTNAGLPVPPGFVVTAAAYRQFLDANNLRDQFRQDLAGLDIEDRDALDAAADSIQGRIRSAALPDAVRDTLLDAYRELLSREGQWELFVAVRSSATMEDTEQASFAGMNRTFLNVRGEDALANAVKEVWASLYSPRVIYYRARLGLEDEPEIAVIVQKMVNSAKSGVAFSVDPATGEDDRMVIEGAFGLGEVVVGGQVEPDHYELAKADLSVTKVHVGRKAFMLTRDENGENVRVDLDADCAGARVLDDEELRAVAELVRKDETHYGTPQDIEWAFEDGDAFLVQSRPITTHVGETKIKATESGSGKELVRGLRASPGSAVGRVCLAKAIADAERLQPGDILVAPMTSPDWVPFMRRAAALVTDAGGMTSHAAIVSREMGLPCIVGARDATKALADGMLVTVDATTGRVLEGEVAVAAPAAAAPPAQATSGERLVTATKVLVNLAEPDQAQAVAARPVDGVGLLRAEFMLLSALDGTHPRRLIEEGRSEEFVERMAGQLRIIAEAFNPRPVIYRSTDFRTNEFRGLKGGEEYEPHEENPMIGLRGAYRYVRDPEPFKLELEVLKRVRHEFGNLHLMIPFVRTGSEMRLCKQLIDESGLTQDRDFELWVMAEVPSIVYWLEEYAALGVAGASIGSNDLTQLVLGVDRDSETLAELFDERDRAVTGTIHAIIKECHRLGMRASICGQAPSVHAEYADTLVRFGIDSISVNPDVIEQARYNVAAAERRILLDAERASTT